MNNYDGNQYQKGNNSAQNTQYFLAQEDGKVRKAQESSYDRVNMSKPFPLAMASQGESLQILQLKGSEGTVHRLIAMGFVPGSKIKLINIIGSSVIVAIGDNRIGLGVGMAQKIMCIKEVN